MTGQLPAIPQPLPLQHTAAQPHLVGLLIPLPAQLVVGQTQQPLLPLIGRAHQPELEAQLAMKQ